MWLSLLSQCMETFLGVPLSILAAILTSLIIFLLAIGLCKACQLLKSRPLPDVVPKKGAQTCTCSPRAVASNFPSVVQCVVSFQEDPPSTLVEKVQVLPKPKLERQREIPATNSVQLVSNSTPHPRNLTDDVKILNKELPYAGGFH